MSNTFVRALMALGLSMAVAACDGGARSSPEHAGATQQVTQPASALVPAPEKSAARTLSDAPPSLRAAVIAAQQRDAGEAFWARDEGGELVASASGLDVRYDELGAHLGQAGAEHGTLSLARVGCAGALEHASLGAPSFDRNRVAYARSAAGVAVDEWYLTGPLGLEQGFTVASPPSCASRGGELVVEVEAEGFEVEADGQALVLVAPDGERLRYAELFAKDATGKALPARMQRTAEGRIWLTVDVEGAAWPVELDPLVAMQEAKLVASDGAAQDRFGTSVALSGDTALVGSFLDELGPNMGRGSAYVFVRSAGVWAQQQKLTASDGGANFGYAVALSGDTALVGSYLDDGSFGELACGSAYVFVRSGAVWTEQQKLTASDGAAGDHFGWSVALSGDTAIVGAIYDNIGASTYQGSAYVFVRSGAVWTEQQKLTASDGAAADVFGYAVALSGDTALVGAGGGDDVGVNADQGSAYVFVRSAAVWTEQQKLTASDGAAEDYLGVGRCAIGQHRARGSAMGQRRRERRPGLRVRVRALGGRVDPAAEAHRERRRGE
jgi:hypothetical protein